MNIDETKSNLFSIDIPTASEKKKAEKKAKRENIEVITVEAGEMKNLLELISIDRFKDYDDWIKIGMVIKSVAIENNLTEHLNLWKYYSRKVPGYENTEDCVFDDKWNSFKQNSYTLGTIYYWLKQDCPDYITILKKHKNTYNLMLL